LSNSHLGHLETKLTSNHCSLEELKLVILQQLQSLNWTWWGNSYWCSC